MLFDIMKVVRNRSKDDYIQEFKNLLQEQNTVDIKQLYVFPTDNNVINGIVYLVSRVNRC